MCRNTLTKSVLNLSFPCDKGNFKVFINYFPDGSLYNYVIWKNETK